MIGVLGGMGPLATADFFNKVIALTDAQHDEDHVPLLLQSDPRIPRRPPAILQGARSPLPELLAGRDRLIAAGAVALAMPCNTAHYWFADLVKDCPVPFISIIDSSCDALKSLPHGAKVAVIGTRATLAAGLFEAALAKRGFVGQAPSEPLMESHILPAIADVKAGRVTDGGKKVEHAVQALLDDGAQSVLLACTEMPVAMQAIGSPLQPRCVDTTLELARACVAWWRAYHP
jgi:aspartate racemase